MSKRLDINKKLIGKPVRVLDSDGEWVGEVIDVKDEDTFIVSNGNTLVAVDIFDVRSLD
mgnify:FL=1|jgi:hypothetical protein